MGEVECVGISLWPYNMEDPKLQPRVLCAAGESHARGKYVTNSESDISSIRCGGCKDWPITTGEGKVNEAKIGEHGRIECDRGYIPAPEFRNTPGPLCEDKPRSGDGLPGRFNFDPWNGKRPVCVEEDLCKDLNCGENGNCEIKRAKFGNSTDTFDKAWCRCDPGYSGETCARSSVKQTFTVDFSGAGIQKTAGKSFREELKEGTTKMFAFYEARTRGNPKLERRVVDALNTRATKFKNMRVCCVQLETSAQGKDSNDDIVEKQKIHSFETEFDFQVTSGDEIESALNELLKAADRKLKQAAWDKLDSLGLAEDPDEVMVNVQTLKATIVVPVEAALPNQMPNDG